MGILIVGIAGPLYKVGRERPCIMVKPIMPFDPKGAEQKGKLQRANALDRAEFMDSLKKATQSIQGKVSGSVAAAKEDFKKKKLEEERDWQATEEEDEDSIDSLVKKIEKKLKKLKNITEREEGKG